jgi:predicted ATPase
MHAAFEHSWNLLSENEREVFKKLSVFRGGFTREAAQQVASASLKVLMMLVNKSLLRRDSASGRFDIHELLRQYAQSYLNASVQDNVSTHDIHSGYYAEFMRQCWDSLKSGGQLVALDDIEREFDNVRAAWRNMVTRRRTGEIHKYLSVNRRKG